MAKNAASEITAAPHALSLNSRKDLELTGVNEVLSFDETLVCLKTSCGNMHISGKDLHVHSLQLNDGRIALSGQIDSIVYTNQSRRSRRSFGDLFR